MANHGMRRSSVTLCLLLATALAGGARAQATGDVFDSFFRYTEREHKAFTQELPGETVDPFTGTLRVSQVDLRLPGKAGLDLVVMRTYNSHLWGRTDLLTTDPLLAEKEHSVLGYGWTFHMGRIRNPNAFENANGTPGCQVLDMPVYEAPDGTARVFYPTTAGGPVLVSRDFWRMQKSCALAGTGGICIWSDKGVRYDFPSTGTSTFTNGTTLFWAVSKITDPFNNAITISYDTTGDRPSLITDTYGRQVAFTYQAAEDGSRLSSMIENGHTYSYLYTLVSSASTGGAGRLPLPGTGRLFLTEFRPPAGTSPSYFYQYGTSLTVAQNQYALTQITYPYGAVMTYGYGQVGFYTGGGESVPMAAVTLRTVGGSAMTPGQWTYGYSSPSSGMQTATVGRPDGRQDSYIMFGFGAVANGTTWKVGLTSSISIGGAQTTSFSWDHLPATVSPVAYPAPNYAPSSTSSCTKPYDTAVYAPMMTQKSISQDSATYTTAYSSFDAYGQPQSVTETGQQTRTTAWTYFSATVTGASAPDMVRGYPLSRHVCIGTACYDDSWTYNGGIGHARDTETLAGTTTTFGYDALGNLATVKNALNQTLTLGTYTNGVPTTFNFNGAFTTSQTPNFEGWITSQTNGRNATTGHSYDPIGRITAETPPLVAPSSSFTYPTGTSCTLTGTPVSVRSPPTACVTMTRGSYTRRSFFDGLGREIATSDSAGVFSSTQYDALGRVTFKSYPFDSSGEVGDSIAVDGLGRPTSVAKAFRTASNGCTDTGSCSTTSYSYSGNCVSTTVQRSAGDSTTTQQCSTSFGEPDERRLTRVTDAAGNAWQYAYTTHGELTTVTAPDVKANESYTYSTTNQFLLTEKMNESSVGTAPSFTYTRNAVGQPATRVDARNITTTYSYEPQLNRLKAIGYSSANPPLIATRGALTNTFDDVNRVTQMSWVLNGRTFTTTPHYNSNGCLDSLTYPTGTVVTQSCDTANRVTSVQIGTGSIVANVQYHPSGQPSSMTYGNGSLVTAAYDDRERLKSATASGIIDLRYTYDGANNVTSFDNLAVAGSSRTMTYDPLDRLLTATAASIPSWGAAVYGYDTVGNRTLNSDNAVTIHYTYDANNRLHAAATGTRPRQMTFAWDAGNHLASSSDGASYFYDGLGRRVQKTDATGTVLYHYDPEGKLIAETDGAGTKLRDYIYLAGKLIAVDGCVTATAPPCTERQWFYTDVKGSVVARADANGAAGAVARFDYKPWGEQLTVPAAQGDRQYDGRVRDPGTGFSDFGARYYWPEIGRFVSADMNPYGAQNMAGLNRYAFGFDNPYKYVDQNGHMPFLVVTGLVGAGAGAIYGAYTSIHSDSGFSWAAVGKGALAGGLLGVGAGATAAWVATGTAIATTAEVGSGAAAYLGIGGGAATAANSANDSSVWNLPPLQRGQVIDQVFGNNLGRTFPTIDRWVNGVATSIKSIDLNAATYQNVTSLTRTVMGYINGVANFAGAQRGLINITQSAIQGRALDLVVPAGAGSAAQLAAIQGLVQYGASVGVAVNVIGY